MDRYQSHIPGSGPYRGTEPPGYRPSIIGGEGSKNSIVGYSASQNSERYEAKTQHIVAFGGILPAMDPKHSPPRRELYKDYVEGNKPISMPWGSTRDHREKVDGFSPKAGHNPKKGSPTTEKVYRYYSSPPREHDYGKYNQHNYKDDDFECNNGVCAKNTKEGAIRSSYLKDDNYDPNQNHKRIGYVPPAYTIAPIVQPRENTYYEKSPTFDNNVKYMGNDHATPNTYTVPIPTQPRKETYYETPHIDNKYRYMGNAYTNLPSIKTRIERGRDMEFSTGSGKNSPVYNSPSRKDHQEIIDSTDARKRYGKASPKTGTRPYGGEYIGTIDSKEAARKYNGVLISN